MELVIRKAGKVLEVLDGGHVRHRFPVGIGKDESGHKQREGDLRTPEGEYRICVKNPCSRYFLSLGLDYPNPQDAAQAFRDGRLTREEHDAIVQAHRAGKIPPWKTALGGEIYIHGHLEKQSWSHGCLRLNDPDMRVLFELTPVGTKVTILA